MIYGVLGISCCDLLDALTLFVGLGWICVLLLYCSCLLRLVCYTVVCLVFWLR